MKRILFKYLSIVLVIVILSVSYTNVSGSGHDFENGELRNDLSSVYNAMDYRVKIRSYIGPTIGYPDGTAGWLGFDLAQFDGTLYSGKFSQVGLFTRSNGITWFVYAEPGVTCLRGTPAWGTLGCIGAISDLSIAYGSERYVELQTQSGQGYWIAKVSNSIGQMVNVAYINYNSTRIYRAMVTMEEPYSVAQDPYLIASFYFSHPQYKAGGVFLDWPQSSGGNNNVVSSFDDNLKNFWCPQQYGITAIGGDYREWYAGTGGQACTYYLFLPYSIYIAPLFIH